MSNVEELDISDFHTATWSATGKPSTSAPILRTPRRTHSRNVSLKNSPSSPDIATCRFDSPQPGTLVRSKTLPRGIIVPPTARIVRRENPELDNLFTDSSIISNLRRWIQCIAIVEFDLDEGPVVNGVCPSFDLPSSVWESVAFSAFPDSLQAEEGSHVHSFRIRDTSQPVSLNSDKGYILCFSYFSQTKDSSSRRGYKQQSLVIMTYKQYPAFFTAVTWTLGALFDSHGAPMLEAACQNIATWPVPTSGSTQELGFVGTVFLVELPHSDDEQQFTETSSFREKYDPHAHILAGSPPFNPPPIELFEASLTHLWSIWECLLLCNDAFLIFGPSPAATSQAIWWFRDLLRPIPLAHDVRPYFVLQDQDNAMLVNKLVPKAGLLLGVTNPFIVRSCGHWPHMLSLGRQCTKSEQSRLGASGPPPGWKTKHKRYISKDRDLLRQLEDACHGSQRNKMEASIALRRHFCSRTTAFLVPLNRYLNTLIPPPSHLHGTASKLQLKPFNLSDFFVSLKAHGSPLPFRSATKRTEFYERWLRSPAFGLWLAQQDEVVQRVLDST